MAATEAPPMSEEVYEQFGVVLARMQSSVHQRHSSCGRAFVVPAFVKPSYQGRPVTWRQCCVIRFWHPADIPDAVTGSLAQKEQLQLRGEQKLLSC